MNSKRLDSKGLRLGIMLMGEKLFIICSILLTIIFSVTPIQASATSAFGIVRVAPPMSICMEEHTHYLEDLCDGSLVTRLLSYTIDLNWYLDQYVEVEGTGMGVECFIINVQNIVILPEPICPPNECSTWADVIEEYNAYVNNQVAWSDVITCYNQYASPGGTITSITVTQPSTTPPRVANGNTLTVQVNADTGATVQVHLANADTASTTTSYWDSGAVTLTEVTSGVYRTVSTFPTVNAPIESGSIKVIASIDAFTSRTVDDETVILDNTAPQVTGATAIGDRKVLVNFNETLYTATSSVAAANFSISPTTGVVSISAATAQPTKTSVLLSFTGTASTGITYTVTASSSVKDETTINGVGSASSATFVTTGPDTSAPTISSIVVDADDCRVTVCFTDDSGSAAVDPNCTKITSVIKGGEPVTGTTTCNPTFVCCTFTPTHCPLEPGDYVIIVNVCDLAGNTAVWTISFTVYGSLTCSADPPTITSQGGTSTISVTGGKPPYTAAIYQDTTDGATITGSGPWTLTPGPTEGSITVRVTDSQMRISDAIVEYEYGVIPCGECPTWGDIIACYSCYVSGNCTWDDCIIWCYFPYTSCE